MKVGIVISIVILVIVAVVFFALFRGVADSPTSLTAANKLAKQTVPEGASAIIPVQNPGGDATPLYLEAIEIAQNREDTLMRDDAAESRPAEEIAELLIDAMSRGRVEHGFLDQYMPMEPRTQPTIGGAFETVSIVSFDHANMLYRQGSEDRAFKLLQALFAMSKRAYEHNDRAYFRWQALFTMVDTASAIAQLPQAEQIDADVAKISAELKEIFSVWEDKYQKVISMVRPPIGDLLNLYHNDEDRTFRLAATFALSYAKFVAGHRGNKLAIDRAIADAVESSDPLIAEAGRVARDTTQKDIRRMR